MKVPFENLLGPRGGAFELGQVRLGGGRVHHAMRTVGQCQKALDLMCKRAVSRTTRDGLPTAYLCRDFVCRLPATRVEELSAARGR